jgi:DnaJ-class molecular chaperone
VAAKPADDYYALLGIDAGAGDEDLRRAWRKLALEWHPDRAGQDATLMFQRISVAYSVLSDPDARAAYDRWYDANTPKPRKQTVSRTHVQPIGPRAPSVMLDRLRAQLNSLLMRGIAAWVDDGLIDLFLTEEEATHGGMATITMRVPVRCPSCNADVTKTCGTCNGQRILDELFSAWLAIRPGVAEGTILTPSAWLPGQLEPVYFRVRLGATA